MKLMADVIDLAINEYLWDGRGNKSIRRGDAYSCEAIDRVIDRNDSERAKIMDFLRSMGVITGYRDEFNCFPSGPKRQYARALWLTWAAMIAEEEGKML